MDKDEVCKTADPKVVRAIVIRVLNEPGASEAGKDKEER